MAEPISAWLCMAVSGRRQHGGNDGYDDEPSEHYSWDDTVPNHSNIKEGDAIVLWDKQVLLGCSIIERIEKGEATKQVHKCPHCGLSGIKARSTRRPYFKCYKCKREFDEPDSTSKDVQTFRSYHEAAWVDLPGALSGAELRSLAVSPSSQLSLRPLRWDEFETALRREGLEGVRIFEAFAEAIAGGHRSRLARVRVGQAGFRRHLLSSFGPSCAFTGRSPLETLDACHLYSYAQIGEHDTHGGFLLRKDLHRLFDAGLLAVHPAECFVDVAPELHGYETYMALQDSAIGVEPSDRMRHWFDRHWTTHRGCN